MGAWEDGFSSGYARGYADSLGGISPRGRVPSLVKSRKPAKAKRKVGKYQKVFGKKLKALKKKHPRSAASVLMKKAHRQTKAAMR